MMISKKSNKKENNKNTVLTGVRAYDCNDCCKSRTLSYKGG
jgi:hypothetical protein